MSNKSEATWHPNSGPDLRSAAEIKAKAWDEGFAVGWHSDRFSFNENPYREQGK